MNLHFYTRSSRSITPRSRPSCKFMRRRTCKLAVTRIGQARRYCLPQLVASRRFCFSHFDVLVRAGSAMCRLECRDVQTFRLRRMCVCGGQMTIVIALHLALAIPSVPSCFFF
jgi:hypothetical protein